MDMTGMKHEIEALAEAHREEFEAVSACIFEHPELAFQEKRAQNELCSLLERHGFSVKRGAGSLDTAFVAEYNSGKPGMTFAFLCEYDALPELGHACGHSRSGFKGDHGKIRDRRNAEGIRYSGGGKRQRKDHHAG